MDPVVSITEDQVDVVVNAVTLTDPERAQIEDIVKRKSEVGAGIRDHADGSGRVRRFLYARRRNLLEKPMQSFVVMV